MESIATPVTWGSKFFFELELAVQAQARTQVWTDHRTDERPIEQVAEKF